MQNFPDFPSSKMCNSLHSKMAEIDRLEYYVFSDLCGIINTLNKTQNVHNFNEFQPSFKKRINDEKLQNLSKVFFYYLSVNEKRLKKLRIKLK